jgi:NitT/TauT family transport system substrate-binding protein
MFRTLPRRFSTQRMKVLTTACVVLLVAGGMAACGDSDGASGDSGGDTIKIAVASATTIFAPVYVAQERGYFKDAGVKVEINSGAGAGAVPMLASGQVDLVYGGIAAPLALGQSRPTSVLLSTVGGFGTATVVSGDLGIKDVTDLAGKRIGTPGTGTTSDSYARLYNKRLGLNADIVPFTTPAALVGAVKSGQVDAGGGTASLYADIIADGSAHVVLKAGDPQAIEVLGAIAYPEGAMFGLTETVDEKHDDMVKVVGAIVRAADELKSQDPAEGAATLKKNDAFASSTEDVLTANLSNDLQFMVPSDGEITRDTWDYALKQYRDWDVIKSSDIPDGITYNKLIDMSALADAKKVQ